MQIQANDPASIDGNPHEVATEAVADATRAVLELRTYLDDVEVQVRNAVMQVAVEQKDGPDPSQYWEASDELRVCNEISRRAALLSSVIGVLAKVRARDSVTLKTSGESGSGRGAAMSK